MALSACSDLQYVYQYVADVVLEGMPCDGALTVISHTNQELIFERKDVHKAVWDEVGGDISKYRFIRDALIRGVIADSGVSYTSADEFARFTI